MASQTYIDVSVLLNSDLRKQQSRGDMKNNMGMKLKVYPFELRNFWETVYFILELLSKLNSYAYNLLDVSISVYLEISYFSLVKSFFDLDLLLQFVCFFRNERLDMDRSND